MRRTRSLLALLMAVPALAAITTAPATADVAPGHVVGTITRSWDGSRLSGATETLYTRTAPGVWSPTTYQAFSSSTGTYSIQAPPGTYRLLASAQGDANAPQRKEFWPNATKATEGKNIVVTSGRTVRANLALQQRLSEMRERPVITGHRRVGAVLTAGNGTWFPARSTFTRQWVRAGVPIKGATRRTYKVTPADLGKALGVVVTAHHVHLRPTTGVSFGTAPIGYGVLTITRRGRLSGTASVGHDLRLAAPVTSPTSFRSYRWLRNGEPIDGATDAVYRLTPADRGQHVGVRVTLTRNGYTDLVRTATVRRTITSSR